MKKIFLIFLLFCSYAYPSNKSIVHIPKPTNINQKEYRNVIELPFGFSADWQGYENIIWIYNSKELSSIALADSNTNDMLWIATYPLGMPLVGKRDIYQESEFLSEMTNPTDNTTIVFYGNSTFSVYELNDDYKAYVLTSVHDNDVLASIFLNSKFIVSFFLDSNDRKTIENILYSIRKIDTSFSKENYLKNIKKLYDNGNLQRALLYSSAYYIHDKNDKENIKLLNKITDKIILNTANIKSEINE
jgi:hypothetical protein